MKFISYNFFFLNSPQYPPRPSGHARSSSLDLTRKMINSSITGKF